MSRVFTDQHRGYMSKVNQINITNLTDVTTLVRILSPFLSQAQTAFQNGINFQDNFVATTVVVGFPSIANQNIQVAHGLATTPIGFLSILPRQACNVYAGSSTILGATFANLKCSVAGATCTILFF